jgi:aryl-alcohol dehydrogenase-like predicted oxidoreductase
MSLPATAYTAFAGDLTVCRVSNGMWQVSGAHGAIDPERAVGAMARYVDAGFTTFDLADHYGPAEELVGELRRRLAARGDGALATVVAFTKWVPRPGPMTRAVVEGAVDRSLGRMKTDALDLLQFHWWEYADDRYLDALRHLDDLRREGKIRHLALTNFDTERLRAILDAGVPVVSNQVQYSLVDRRPEAAMARLCEERGVVLLAYGTVCGGLLSERYVGHPEPRPTSLATASLRKYKQMVDAWGGWSLFQELLAALARVAARRGAAIPAVAVRYVLDRPAVATAILGVRFGESEHLAATARVFDVALAPDDVAEIDAVLDRARDLVAAIGDCGDEYRGRR